ncbi:hypothetical protein HOLleu_10622 [Holothuria leucospilota]|uniref:Uncharacterized protein n=1 Tax=Holothuria leucospilota TaxID=206669 RepID=A0A9Q1CEJ8_HOLLE|nr:hypothetical protein HOLleu_10622 [Holothuria leucospilota]
MFSARVLLLLVLFGAVAIIASSPLQKPSDKEEFDLTERSLDRLFKRLQREERHLPEDETHEDIDELVARVAKLNPGTRSWGHVWRHYLKPHAHVLASHALTAALGR